MIKYVTKLGVWLLVVYSAAFLIFALLPSKRQSDIAVVLGNEVLANGQPSRRLQARLDAALEAYREKRVAFILVSGGRSANGFNEAEVMRDYMVRNGVPISSIMVDNYGINTMETARNAVAIMRRMHLHKALIVTQYFHIPRSVLAFHLAGADAVATAYPEYVEWRDMYSIARELIALPYYVWFHASHQSAQ